MISPPKDQAGAAGDANRPSDGAPPWRKTTWILLLILGVALTLRLGLATYRGLEGRIEAGSDEQELDVYSWNLAQGYGQRGSSPDVPDPDHLTAWRPPGVTLLWAGVFKVVGHRLDAIRVVHCVLGTLSVWLVFRIGRRAFSETVGLLAAAGCAVYPLAVLQSTEFLPEPLGVFLFLLFLDVALLFAAAPTWTSASAAGAALGLALLTRANYASLLPLLGIWSLWQFRGSGRALIQSFAIFLVAGLVLSPWVARNYYVFGEVIPFSTGGGSCLLQGNNRLVVTDPKLFGYSVWDTQIPEYRAALQSAGNEVERDRRAKALAIQWLSENRDKWGFLAWHKFIRSWTPFLTHNPSASSRLFYLLTWGPVLTLFCIAAVPTLIQSLKTGSPVWLLHLAVLHYVANSVVFFANIRYRAPIDPICLIFAAWTLSYALALLTRRVPRGSANIVREPAPYPA